MSADYIPLVDDSQPNPFSYSELRISAIHKLLDEINATKARIVALQRDVSHVVLDALANAPNREEEREIAYDLYWWRHEVDVSLLAMHYRVDTSKVRNIVGVLSLPVQCKYCDKDFEVIVPSRQQLRDYDDYTCDECKAAIENNKRKEQQARLREMETRERAEAAEIARLRALPYREYLQSEHWKNTRAIMLKRRGYKCELCNSTTSLHVHHKSYERLGCEWQGDLIVLCGACHAKFHDKPKSK